MVEGELKKRSILFASKVNLKHGNPQIIMDEVGRTIGNFHDLVDEAKKDIEDAITKHLEDLIDAWKNLDKTKIPHMVEKYQQVYIDAYSCILHNHKEHDVFKVKKWFGDSS